MKCPSCGAAVEDGADLCLECGEPMGESPAAKAARSENVIRPPTDTFKTPVARITPKPTPPPPTRPAGAPISTPRSSPIPTPRSSPIPTPRSSPMPPAAPTVPAMPAAKRKWAAEEPEPVRCPGCGVKSHAARCPNCGTKLKHDDD